MMGVDFSTLPHPGHQSCWYAECGIDAIIMSEYVEVAHMINVEEGAGGVPIRRNEFMKLMCQELGVGDEDSQVVRFMDKLTSVRGAKAVIVAQVVNGDNGDVAG